MPTLTKEQISWVCRITGVDEDEVEKGQAEKGQAEKGQAEAEQACEETGKFAYDQTVAAVPVAAEAVEVVKRAHERAEHERVAKERAVHAEHARLEAAREQAVADASARLRAAQEKADHVQAAGGAEAPHVTGKAHGSVPAAQEPHAVPAPIRPEPVHAEAAPAHPGLVAQAEAGARASGSVLEAAEETASESGRKDGRAGFVGEALWQTKDLVEGKTTLDAAVKRTGEVGGLTVGLSTAANAGYDRVAKMVGKGLPVAEAVEGELPSVMRTVASGMPKVGVAGAVVSGGLEAFDDAGKVRAGTMSGGTAAVDVTEKAVIGGTAAVAAGLSSAAIVEAFTAAGTVVPGVGNVVGFGVGLVVAGVTAAYGEKLINMKPVSDAAKSAAAALDHAGVAVEKELHEGGKFVAAEAQKAERAAKAAAHATAHVAKAVATEAVHTAEAAAHKAEAVAKAAVQTAEHVAKAAVHTAEHAAKAAVHTVEAGMHKAEEAGRAAVHTAEHVAKAAAHEVGAAVHKAEEVGKAAVHQVEHAAQAAERGAEHAVEGALDRLKSLF